MRVSAVIVNNNKVLLIHRKMKGREYWVFPGGGVKKNETLEKAIKREVLEETNLKVTECFYSFDYMDENKVAHPVFVCKVESGIPKLGGPEADKHSKDDWYHPEWIKLESAIKLNIYPEEGIKVLENIIKK
jgi:ADP-ribose pyrophosphatase YjhB (NUDIX family)